MWLDYGINRDLAKRPVMVLPYGGTLRSCVGYVLEKVAERGDRPGSDGDTGWLGRVLWDAITDVVVAPQLAMEWLRAGATVANSAELPLVWTTPSGFPIHQAYPTKKLMRVKTVLFGERFDPSLVLEDQNKIDPRAQITRLPPNFVHGLDAAALVAAVCEALDRGVTDFAMVHDSYATHATESQTLASALRDAFVGMYEEQDVLRSFASEAIPSRLRHLLPPVPFVGGLDIKEVRNSLYFFS